MDQVGAFFGHARPHRLLHGQGDPAGERHSRQIDCELLRATPHLRPGAERETQCDVSGGGDGGDRDEHPGQAPVRAEVSDRTPAAPAMTATMNDHLSGK